MGEVVCTVIYLETHKRDLILPDDVPVHRLVNVLAAALGTPKDENVFYELHVDSGSKQERIPDSRTLQQAYICNGTVLRLSQDDEISDNLAFLQVKKDQRFRLRKNTIIGRLTRDTHVDIDLTPLDANKVVSRRHAVINCPSLHYLIKDMDSHNGTYVNRVRLKKDQSVVLHPGDEICFGTLEKGVRLIFIHL